MFSDKDRANPDDASLEYSDGNDSMDFQSDTKSSFELDDDDLDYFSPDSDSTDSLDGTSTTLADDLYFFSGILISRFVR